MDELKKQLKKQNPDRKGFYVEGVYIPEDDEIAAEILSLIIEAIQDGVNLFGETVALDVDYASANRRAIEYANQYMTEWLKKQDEVSMETIRTALNSFAQTPGATIEDVVAMVETEFGDARAERIAVTETTRMYAEGNQLAGEDTADQWPGVAVTKRWFTNNDDRVCPVCGILNDKEVLIDETFSADGIEYDNPPAHPNCRCWTSVGTV